MTFDRECIVRIVDEFPLSTEDTLVEGLVSEHFSYRVEGAAFARAQSKPWKETNSAVHYQFVTGSACLDVLSGGTPTFEVVARRGDRELGAPECR
ncbi:hypothetical protein G4G27_09705 [Sphingomonas sp. So64.6b]|nr:hypothetical protein G4G27_09705 [Sphingomonas sp. So64.6b]